MVSKAYRCARLTKNLEFGTWLNDGVIYIDVVCNTKDKEQAITEAKILSELAIWDCVNKQEIKL